MFNLLLPRIYYVVLPIAQFFVCSGLAAQEPEWQLGAGLSVLDFRLYPGSRDNKTYLLPLPYFTYKSKLLEIDRGIRGLLPSNSDWHLDISADLGLPVDSDDSHVRTGMPDLDAMIQIGPSLEYLISGNKTSAEKFQLELPLRTGVTVDFDQQANQGWIIEPRLVYEKDRMGSAGLFVKAKLGLRYATQDYHAYYYDVDQAYATPQRPMFESKNGYSGLVIDLRATWRQNDILFWGILRYQNLRHSVIENSPLVEDQDYYLIGIGISWILAASDYVP